MHNDIMCTYYGIRYFIYNIIIVRAGATNIIGEGKHKNLNNN